MDYFPTIRVGLISCRPITGDLTRRALAGVAGYAAGLTWLGIAATAAALIAAFLNAAFAYCLGCEMYLLLRRIRPDRQALAGHR